MDTEAHGQSEPANRLGPYELRGELGRGGMGAVYRAYRPDLKREYALKVILPGQDASAEAIARFRREAQAAAQLSGHPGIVGVHDIGEADGKVYFAMDLVEGASLERFLDEGALEPARAGALVAQAARALHVAHGAGILHRDVKPGNILVDRAGNALVADFGLAATEQADADSARLTQSGVVMGTAAYMPPEQARGATLDARADVWALGATLYECLVGEPPFGGGALFDVLARLLRDDPKSPRRRDPRVPADVDTIVMKCLEKDPERRYPTAGALAADLERWANGEPITARPASLAYRARRWAGRHRLAVVSGLAAGGAAAAIVGGILVPQWLSERAERERHEAALRDQQARELASLRAREAARPHLEAGRRVMVRMHLRLRDPEYTTAELARLAEAADVELQKALRADPSLVEARLALARAWGMAGDRDRQAAELKRVLQEAPEFATAYVDLVREAIDEYERLVHDSGAGVEGVTRVETPELRARRESLEAAIDKIRRHSKDDLELLYGEAMLKFARGDYRGAADLLAEYVQTAPDDAKAWYWLGHALYHVADFEPAEQALSRSIACDARAPAAWMNRANVRKARGDREGALADYARASVIAPAWADVYATRGGMLVNMRKFDAALQDLKRAVELNPKYVGAWNNLGIAYRLSGDIPRARASLEQAIALDPSDAVARLNYGDALLAGDDLVGALAQYDKAIALRPDSWGGYAHRGAAWMQQQNYARAIQDYSRVLELAPDEIQSWMQRAIAHRRLGRMADAIADLGEVIRRKPGLVRAYEMRRDFRLIAGDSDGASADQATIVKLDPDGFAASLGQGQQCLRRGKYAEAIPHLKRALEMQPGEAGIYSLLGLAEQGLGNFEAAATHHTRAIELQPTSELAWYNRGTLRIEQGDAPAAIADFSRVLELNPRHLSSLVNRGTMYRKLGRLEEAARDFQGALRLAPRNWDWRGEIEGRLRELHAALRAKGR